MKAKYSLALLAGLSLLPLSLNSAEATKEKREYTIVIKNLVSDRNKAAKLREEIMKTSLGEFKAEEYTEKGSKGGTLYGTLLKGLSSSSKKELDEMVNRDASAFANIYTKEDISNIKELRAEFMGVMDAFLNGDKERFCSYLGKKIYTEGGKILSKKEFCSQLEEDKMTQCKERGISLAELIVRKNTAALPFHDLMKRAGKNDFLREGDYAIVSKPSDMCLGDQIGFIFRKENGFWRIVSMGG